MRARVWLSLGDIGLNLLLDLPPIPDRQKNVARPDQASRGKKVPHPRQSIVKNGLARFRVDTRGFRQLFNIQILAKNRGIIGKRPIGKDLDAVSVAPKKGRWKIAAAVTPGFV